MRKDAGKNKIADFFQVVVKRRSIREFSPHKIPKNVLYRLINVVRYAPSSLDGQPWEIIIVTDKRLKEELAAFKNKWCPAKKREYKADFLKGAPVVLVVCVDNKKSYNRWIENGIIAATYLTLAACALGLGSTFMTAFNLKKPKQIKEVRKILSITNTINPVCILPIGYPSEKPKLKKLRELKGIIHYETY